MALTLTTNNWKDEVINSEKPVVVDFSATWCSPCRILNPIIDKISTELKNVKIGKVDIEENRDLAVEYKVSSIPSLVFFKNGKEIHRFVGIMNENKLKDLISDKFSN
jgi:thioredoxin